MGIYREAADELQLGRKMRLAGKIVSAMRHEQLGEWILEDCDDADKLDTLMTAWENSMASSPIELEEWRATGAYSQMELLEAGYIEKLPHVTGGGL